MGFILFSYQNCGKKKAQAAAITSSEALTAPPTSVAVDSASLQNCPNGGIAITTYLDANINGKWDADETILGSKNVCNGANGTNGSDGKGGGIIVNSSPAGVCATGGIQITTFIDENNNGLLDASEIMTSKSSVCNGANGTNGASSQITVTKATTAQCLNSGVVYTTSTDSTKPVSTVVCNGANGINASISQRMATPSQCPMGGTVLVSGTSESEPVFSVICNGAKGDIGATGADGQNAYITTSVANPYQCAQGGVVISTWTNASNPNTEVVCNGTNGTNGVSPFITTQAATPAECSAGGFVVTTSSDKMAATSNIICNGSPGAKGNTGATGTDSAGYLAGIVGPLISGKNYSACHHDFLFFPATGSSSTGWLVFRHQKNGLEDQGIGATGFNVWNVDISNFNLISEVGNITYCSLTYDSKASTLQYTVVDKTDGMDGKTGIINLK